MTEESVSKMSHEELLSAVIRLLNVKEVPADGWQGQILLPDHLADAFRNR